MSKRRTTPKLPGSLLTVGLDIGYGVVKAVTDETVIAFPSVMGHAREIKFQQDEITERHSGDQLADDEGTWFVGDLALAQLPPGELLRLRGRTANEAAMGNLFRLRLAKVAIAKLLAGQWNRDVVHLRLATGLPVDAAGEVVDYSAAVEEALGTLRSATLNLMSEKWKSGATVDVIYLSGGGAELVAQEVLAAYPQTFVVRDAQLANARGYLHYARFTARPRD